MRDAGLTRGFGSLVVLCGVCFAALAIPGGPLVGLLGFGLLSASRGSGLGSASRIATSHGVPRSAWIAVSLGVVVDALLIFGFGFDLGGEDSAQVRMLRLARVASLAIPLLAHFHAELADRLTVRVRAWRMGTLVFSVASIGLPATLMGAALFFNSLKYILFIPADAAIVGVVCSFVVLGEEHGGPRRRLERAGLMAIAASMVIGLGMGGYAFDGPMPVPEILSGDHGKLRVLLRAAHAGAICFGLLVVSLARLLRPISGREGTAGDPQPRSEPRLRSEARLRREAMVERLNVLSLEHSFVPERDIDWSSMTTGEEFGRLYREWSLLEGTGLDASFDDATRVTYAKYQQMNLMLFTALLERHGLANLAQAYDLDASQPFTEYIGHFVKEESYHYTMFTRAIRAIAATMPGTDPLPSRGLDLGFRVLFGCIRAIPFEAPRAYLSFTLFRFAERVTLFADQSATRVVARPESLVEKVWRCHALDEVRHVAFDTLVIDERRPTSAFFARLLTIVMGVVAGIVSLLLNANEVWVARRLGVPVRVWHLPRLLRSTKAPFKRRVFGLIQSELSGRGSAS